VPFLAESLVHTVDPFAIHITDTLVRWYGLAYATGFLVAWGLLLWLARTRRTPLTPTLAGDFITWCILGVVVGWRSTRAAWQATAASRAWCWRRCSSRAATA
jgi:prolipoprotein diacylglyceryltransferase